MPNCSVRGCTNKSGHLFPKNNPALKRKWLKFVRLSEQDISVHSLICKIHFDEDAFDQHDPVPGLPPPRKRLRPNAVPTLWPNLMEVEHSITLYETPRKKSRQSSQIVYDATAPANSKKICLAEVDTSCAQVLSEKQLGRVVERIKDKLVRNAHPSAIFPAKWQNSNMFAGTPKIREGSPPVSMPCLVAMALEANRRLMATPSQIAGFISENFPCYKLTDRKWHRKVFETLEKYRLFQKVSSSLTDCPKKTFYQFVPDRKTVMSPEEYEAFTDPSFDESRLDPSHAVISSPADIFYDVASEDIEEARVDEFDEELGTILMEAKAVLESAADVIDVGTSENSESAERAELIAGDDETEPDDSQFDGSSSSGEESVTFLECSYCAFVAASTVTISNHVLQKHWNGKNHCCTQCNYVTPNQEKLKDHKATHKK